MEKHFGELAIQRLHRLNKYEHGNLRVLNKREFVRTLEFGYGNLRF